MDWTNIKESKTDIPGLRDMVAKVAAKNETSLIASMLQIRVDDACNEIEHLRREVLFLQDRVEALSQPEADKPVTLAQAEGGWHDNLSEMLNLMFKYPHAWPADFRIKYMNFRIDWRNLGYYLTDRHGVVITPDEVKAAVAKFQRWVGRSMDAPDAGSPNAEPGGSPQS